MVNKLKFVRLVSEFRMKFIYSSIIFDEEPRFLFSIDNRIAKGKKTKKFDFAQWKKFAKLVVRARLFFRKQFQFKYIYIVNWSTYLPAHYIMHITPRVTCTYTYIRFYIEKKKEN